MKSGYESYFSNQCFKAMCCLVFGNRQQTDSSLRNRLEQAFGPLCILDSCESYREVLSESLWHPFSEIMKDLKDLSTKSDQSLASIAQKLVCFFEQFHAELGARHPECTVIGKQSQA